MAIWVYKVKKTNDKEKWNPELESWVGKLLYENDIEPDSMLGDSDGWYIIRTPEWIENSYFTLPLLVHESCLEKLRLCDCPHMVVMNRGCQCGGY